MPALAGPAVHDLHRRGPDFRITRVFLLQAGHGELQLSRDAWIEQHSAHPTASRKAIYIPNPQPQDVHMY